MRIIFLDIDGVLNWTGTEDRYCGFIGLDPELIARFNRIIDAVPDAKIVISSTWRHAMAGSYGGYKTFKGLIKLLHDRGLKGTIIDKTPKRFSYVPRGSEIREWLEDNEGKYTSFVILDDDSDGMAGYTSAPYGEAPFTAQDLRPFHVLTNWSGDPNVKLDDGTDEPGGLQDRHIEAAIRVLLAPPLPEGWERHYRQDRHIAEAICTHGVGHPTLLLYEGDGIHGCDGCCKHLRGAA